VSTALSLIIPAYNEAERLPAFLESACSYLADRYPGSHEVIVVDDGSEDATGDVVRAFSEPWSQLDLITCPENQGKGAAVRRGMLAGSGDVLLFADADGASPITEEARLVSAIAAGADVAVGSRLVRAPDVVRRRDWRRAVAGRIFARVARWMVPVSVRDTQCGFKMFRRDAARRLFPLSQEQGYMFDIELLALADHLGYRVAEVPIHWTEIPGSKLKMSREWRHILSGLRRTRRRLRELKAGAQSPETNAQT
jgi:dolichyl-phosphate beta-glucosyltransferase